MDRYNNMLHWLLVEGCQFTEVATASTVDVADDAQARGLPGPGTTSGPRAHRGDQIAPSFIKIRCNRTFFLTHST